MQLNFVVFFLNIYMPQYFIVETMKLINHTIFFIKFLLKDDNTNNIPIVIINTYPIMINKFIHTY